MTDHVTLMIVSTEDFHYHFHQDISTSIYELRTYGGLKAKLFTAKFCINIWKKKNKVITEG